MDTLLSNDDLALEQHCAKVLEQEWPISEAIRTLGPDGSGHDDRLHRMLASAGWIGFSSPAEFGGGGMGLVELGLVYRAAGYRLLPASFYASVHAALLIDCLATREQASALLPPLLDGSSLACVASAEPHASDTPALWHTAARRTSTGWSLSGHKYFVPFAGISQTVLIVCAIRDAWENPGWGVFAVPQDKLQPRLQSTFGGEKFYELSLKDVELGEDALLGGQDAIAITLSAFADIQESAACLQIMEMIGGIQAVLDRTTEYVKERIVFGKPVGANQAPQHMLANIFITLAGARVAALRALSMKAKGQDVSRALPLAKLAVGKLYTDATISAHQLWGSMGYARETGLYLWSERAKVTDATFGSRHYHRQALLKQLAF
ncbi:acyl-CoA/acyl-ACP dehydrogenase [Sphingobium sp. JS3065]|uniref:acyl-CoA dehydrogenase family protein n=1 Tax=Sphingobium sp. JS3065 TaxID=2970925 RepID=UPI002265199D|nr:acyl-CoA dehydrogenase family protein [Sphingobium sp. JS3065]UZW57501.1 acyl-CoA/acyl-ACP dehydrogenase [Sphingobium sp. JS3065]